MIRSQRSTSAGTVLLADNRPFGDAEYALVCQQKDAIRRIVDSRETYVRQNGLDAAFSLPDGNWSPEAPNDFPVAFRHVLDGDALVASRLRLYAQAFSGYQLLTLSDARGTHSVNEIDASCEDRLRKALRVPDAWVARWQAIVGQCPDRFTFRPPPILGEVGWLIGNVIVNHDTYSYQERLNLLFEAGVLEWLERREQTAGRIRILEIGGGYGALASALKRAFPLASYTICDLPESLLFSGCYLRVARPDCTHAVCERAADVAACGTEFGFRYLPNFLFPALVDAGESFDLVVNTLSFSEMTPHQVGAYGRGIARLIGQEGVLFEQNQDNRHLGLCYCKDHLADCFSHRYSLRPKTVPQIQKGIADIWSNRSFEGILSVEAGASPISPSRLAAGRPMLHEQGLDGYNIVEFGGRFHALAQSVGRVDFQHLDDARIREWIADGRCFVGSTLAEAKSFVIGGRHSTGRQMAANGQLESRRRRWTGWLRGRR